MEPGLGAQDRDVASQAREIAVADKIQVIGIIIDFIFPRCYKVIVCKIS
jgi:hypothetical protein